MSNFGFDPFWRWLDSRSPEDLPGFRVRPVDAAPADVPGLHNWRPPATGGVPLAPDGPLAGTEAASSPWWERPTEPVPEDKSQSRWPWSRAPTDEVPGFRVTPDGSVQTGEPAGNVRLMAGAFGPIEPQVQPNDVMRSNGVMSSDVVPRPWWERPTGSVLEDKPQSHWPWLRVPGDEAPDFLLKTDGSVGTGELGSGNVRLMAGARAPIEPQEELNDVTGSNGMTSSGAMPSPPSAASPSPFSAGSIALPASAGGAVDLATLVARGVPLLANAVPALTGLGSAAVGSLPFLFIPNNTQSETTDLSDGLRARIRPGQRTVEIERRVEKGLFGTSFGAKWETLPVDAQQVVGRDGSVNTVINHEQLNRALGPNALAESKVADTSAMAQPPKDEAPQQLPPTSSTPPAGDATNAGSAPATQSLAPAKIDARVLEEAKPRDPEEEERLLACRAVRVTPDQPAPSVHYRGPGAIETAVNVDVASRFPAPTGGYAYDPEYSRHWNGYKGELELKNRIEKAVPYEKIVHYGNPAGDQGPDVLSVGPDGYLMEWNSKSRTAVRQITPSMVSKPSLRYERAHQYVWSAMLARAVDPGIGVRALKELDQGNYNVCTVGTGNAYGGYFEAVRKGVSKGRRR